MLLRGPILLAADLFTLLIPSRRPLPIVANLPHSGLHVPEEVAAQFTPEHLRSLPHSDWHLQELYSFLPSIGITVLQANYSRYVIDLNRALKPPFFGSFWSAAVAETTAFKQPVYARKPSPEDVRSRINEYYTPYHQKLTQLLNEKIDQFGQVYLLDLHSFLGLIPDDVCLGNANGQTCTARFIDQVSESFTQQGYQAVQNKVFSGGYITRHYGQQPLVEALQIELRYPLYLSDDQIETEAIPTWQSEKFAQAKARLQRIFESFCSASSFAR